MVDKYGKPTRSLATAAQKPWSSLSAREREIAGIYAQGKTSKEIADKLFISQTTVRNHVASIYRKLRISNKAELINLLTLAHNNTITTEADPTSALDFSDDPSVAVLPFANMSGDPEQEYFSDGLGEDITTKLSKIPGLFVIARNSAYVYRDQSVDLKKVSRELGVRYIVEGSVRKAGNRVRITTQLIDGKSGGHVWAEHYDGELTDIFSLQDAVTQKIVAALVPELSTHKLLERREPTVNLESYDHFLRGRQYALMDTQKSNVQARSLLEKALELDPNFSLACAHLARNHVISYINRWGDEYELSLEKAISLGQRAIELDKTNPFAYFALSTAVVWDRQLERAELEARKAISLDPNFADGYAALGMIMIYAGKAEESIVPVHTAMRIDPHYRDIFLHILALAYFHSGQYQDAEVALKRRLIRKPESDISRALLASTYGHLGATKKARSTWKELISINPNYSLEHRRKMLPYKNDADFDGILDGLRKAGVDTP